MMKRHKISFEDYFEMLISECQNVMDLTMQKKVVSSTDSIVTKLQNGLGKNNPAIATSKEKPVPISNFAAAVGMSKKHKTTVCVSKKKISPQKSKVG